MPGKQTVLVVNDDGPESPFLPATLEAIVATDWCKEVRFVVPAEEQSWIAQSVTRFRPLYVRPKKLGNFSGYTVSGTPADCASLGIANLWGTKPDLVISGINMGTNAGLPYFLSSGTVGGAAEAFLHNVRAIAISAVVPGNIFRTWLERNFRSFGETRSTWLRLANAGVAAVTPLLQSEKDGTDIFSINLPWEATAATPRVMTRIKPGKFRPLFSKTGENEYRHQSGTLEEEVSTQPQKGSPGVAGDLPYDLTVLHEGKISVTAVNYKFS